MFAAAAAVAALAIPAPPRRTSAPPATADTDPADVSVAA